MTENITQAMMEDCSNTIIDIAEGLLRNASEQNLLDVLMDAVCIYFSEISGDEVTTDDIDDFIDRFEDRLITTLGEPCVIEPEFIDDDPSDDDEYLDDEDEDDFREDVSEEDEKETADGGTVTLSLNITRRISRRRAKLFNVGHSLPVVNAMMGFLVVHSPIWSSSVDYDEDITDRELDMPYDNLEDK